MISRCPHCAKDLSFSEAQQEKIQAALGNLKAGALKLGCPHCKQPIHLKADGSLVEEPKARDEAATGQATDPPAAAAQTSKNLPSPPAYPDISWLATGMYGESDVVAEMNKVLILMPEGAARAAVAKAFADRDYQAEFPESAADAIAQMRFVTFAAVVLDADYDGSLAESTFHAYMAKMPMEKRRYICYVLVGRDFHTLYDLEALAFSANVVVNVKEVAQIDTILKKAMNDYDALFGPYIEAIKAAL